MGIIFFIVFVSVIGIFIATARNGISAWNKNNNSPCLTVTAEIVSKRTEVLHQNHPNAGDPTGAHGYSTTFSTCYYVTFQPDSGERMEFSVTCSEYKILSEGDIGKLTFQGTRYLAFEHSH